MTENVKHIISEKDKNLIGLIQDVFLYTGVITMDIVNDYSNKLLEKYLYPDYILSKKIFSVFIELSQNVGRYSEERESNSGVGTFYVCETSDYVFVITKNKIKKQDEIILKTRCDIINSSDAIKLRELKRMQWSTNHDKVSAHIGLIRIALVSGNNLHYIFDENDTNTSYYTIIAKINKKSLL